VISLRRRRELLHPTPLLGIGDEGIESQGEVACSRPTAPSPWPRRSAPVGVDDRGNSTHLVAMKKPDRTVVRGRIVFLCCSGCKTALNQEPDRDLAKTSG
jgi:hypothetical protein